MVLLDGSLSENPALRSHLQAYAEWQGADLIGIVADRDCSEHSDEVIRSLARSAVRAAEEDISTPRTFIGVAGINLFRDEIFGHLRMVFRADHKFYRRNGIYRTMIHRRPMTLAAIRLVGALTSIPLINRRMIGNMRSFMLVPYRRVLDRIRPEAAVASPEEPLKESA